MDLSQVPETATEKYYERLAENIKQRIQEARNKRAKERLEMMLEEVQQRWETLKLISQEEEADYEYPKGAETLILTNVVEEGVEEAVSEGAQTPLEEGGELVLTEVVEEGAEEAVSEEAQAALEEGEELVLTEVVEGQESELAVPGDADVLLLTDIIEEVVEEKPDEDLTEREQEVIKNRLQGVLDRYQDKRHAFPQQRADLLLTDIMQEISEETPLDKTDLSDQEQDKVKDRLKTLLEAFQEEAQNLPQKAVGEDVALGKANLLEAMRLTQEALQARQKEGEPGIQEGIQAFPIIAGDTEFSEICEKVSQGEPLALFDAITLSPREQLLIDSFTGFLSSYKGLKKQQSFEMQHLVARSIRELELIFKTYRINGYLKAELHNVYNRLLNLRSRFSILLR